MMNRENIIPTAIMSTSAPRAEEYFTNLDDAITWIGEMTEREFKSEDEINAYFDEIKKYNDDTYCYIHEIKISNE